MFNSGTSKTLRHMDLITLLLASVGNAYVGLVKASDRGFRWTMLATSLLQLLQALWVVFHSYSYSRWRLSVTWLQRARWALILALTTFLSCSGGSTSSDLPSEFIIQHVRGDPGTWRAFFAISLLVPCLGMLCALVHPLPLKHELLGALLMAVPYIKLWLPYQLAALKLFDVKSHAQQACHHIQTGMTAPFAHLHLHQQASVATICDGPHAASMALSALFVLLAVLLPLQLVVWQEEGSFRQALQASAGRHAAPGLPFIITAMFFWAWCAIAWWVLAGLHAAPVVHVRAGMGPGWMGRITHQR